MEDFVGKLVAARDAIGASDFFLVARTDARNTSAKNGLEDAIRRANLYVVGRQGRGERRGVNWQGETVYGEGQGVHG